MFFPTDRGQVAARLSQDTWERLVAPPTKVQARAPQTSLPAGRRLGAGNGEAEAVPSLLGPKHPRN